MNEEFFLTDPDKGWIEVITGSMFSGKTEELIRRIKRAELANQKVQIFKHILDARYSKDKVVSHDKTSIKSIQVNNSREILAHLSDVKVVGIDEGQFFDLGLVEVVEFMANSGIRVIIAGLDMDYRGEPFGPMPELMARAEFVTKLHAICMKCGGLASYSHRKIQSSEIVLPGTEHEYEPLCRRCFNIVNEKNDMI